ncbi:MULTISPECIES: DUF6285 domain-containing protein [Hyphomonas]|jgi:hypothetical protein|uniref:DUF6285 domain-containing protein n=2 Tax=Hyphomonas TaxID=85 RepID=UPI0035123675
MHDAPSQKEMIAAVKAFIDDTAMPNLKGHAAFHARVASNVLATVLRELEIRPLAENDERERLSSLLNTDQNMTISELNLKLCELLRQGELGLDTPGLLEHLKTTTIAQLSIDQPNYSGLPSD